MIPQSFIQDLLYRADIVEVVGRYVTLKKAGANLSGLCPFHKEKSPSFSVSPAKQFYHCFGCGAHGTVITFLMENQGLPFPEAVEMLAGQMGIEVPRVQSTPDQQQERSRQAVLVEKMQVAQGFYKQTLKTSPEAVSYLKSRGLTGQIAARFGLGYSPTGSRPLANCFADYDQNADLVDAGLVIVSEEGGRRYDRFRERVMFPIRNSRGDIIGFGGRILEKGEPKYLNSPETILFSKGQELYGLFEGRASIRDRGYALVVEGYMDVVALAQWGFENSVATLGTAVTATHVQRLFRQTDRVVFSFDGDKAGRKAAWRALEASVPHAAEQRRIEFVFLPAEHDPDSYIRELGAEAFELAVSQAMPLSQFLMKEVADRHRLSDVEGRAAAVAMLRPLIQQIPPSAYRVALLRAIADPLLSTPAELEQQFGLRKKDGKAISFTPKPKRENVRAGIAPEPERRVATLLLANPDQVGVLREYVDQLIQTPNGSTGLTPGQQGLVALVNAVVAAGGGMTAAHVSELFRNTAYSEWVSLAANDVLSLDSEINLETELAFLTYQCWDGWIGQEMNRLIKSGLSTPEDQDKYRFWSQRRNFLKQQRTNPI